MTVSTSTEKHAAPTHIDRPLAVLTGVLVVGAIAALLDATIVNVAVDTLGRDLHTDLATIQWVATAYLLAVAVAVPTAAWAVDRFGARRLWLTGLALFTLGSVLCATAVNAGMLIAFRALQGLGGGVLEPTMLTVLARAAGPQRAGKIMGLVSVPLLAGPVAGPIIGGAILQGADWRWIFIVNLPVGAIGLLAAWRTLPRDDRDRSATLDRRGLALLVVGFAAAVYSLSQAATTGLNSTRVLIALAVTVVALIGYGLHASQRGKRAVIDLHLFTRVGYSASVAVMTLVGAMLFPLLFPMPLYFQANHHSVLTAGLLVVPQALGSMISMPLAGRLSDKIGARPLVPLGAILVGAPALTFALTLPTLNTPTIECLLFIIGLGLGCMGAPTMAAVYRTVPSEATSRATAALFMLNQTGASLGIAVVTLMLGTTPHTDAFTTPFLWIAASAAVVIFASRLLPPKTEAR